MNLVAASDRARWGTGGIVGEILAIRSGSFVVIPSRTSDSAIGRQLSTVDSTPVSVQLRRGQR